MDIRGEDTITGWIFNRDCAIADIEITANCVQINPFACGIGTGESAIRDRAIINITYLDNRTLCTFNSYTG